MHLTFESLKYKYNVYKSSILEQIKHIIYFFIIYETSCVFWIPDRSARGYKIHIMIKKYGIKSILSRVKLVFKKIKVLQNASTTIIQKNANVGALHIYNVIKELHYLNLSNSFQALFNKQKKENSEKKFGKIISSGTVLVTTRNDASLEDVILRVLDFGVRVLLHKICFFVT